MQALKLLELPEPIQDSIDAGRVAPSIGYEIAKAADAGRQIALAEKVAMGEVGRAEVRDLTVVAPRPKRWSCTLDDGAQVTVTIPAGRSMRRRPSRSSRRRSSEPAPRSPDRGTTRPDPSERGGRAEDVRTRPAGYASPRGSSPRPPGRRDREQTARDQARRQAVNAYLERLTPAEREALEAEVLARADPEARQVYEEAAPARFCATVLQGLVREHVARELGRGAIPAG